MRISKLLEIDETQTEGCVADAFGDSFLCASNLLYHQVRSTALRNGISFSSADSPLWRDYRAMPLLSLPSILSTRTVPYMTTKDSLRRIIRKFGDHDLAPEILATYLGRNYMLHESCHCIAELMLLDKEPNLRAIGLSESECRVALSLIGEAFATAIERLCTCTSDGIEIGKLRHFHAYLYAFNSYLDDGEEFVLRIARAREELGAQKLLSWLKLCYFYTILFPALTPVELVSSINQDVDFKNHLQNEHHLIVAEICERLNQDFKAKTTPLYFKLLGLHEEFILFRERRFARDRAVWRAIIDILESVDL
jgi:hypothetical protein